MSRKAELTTLHGVHWAFDSRLPLLLRLGWIVAILSSWSYMLYLTYSRITYLSTHPKKTVVDMTFSPQGLEFPGITICNNNLLKRSTIHRKEYAELERFLEDYIDYRFRHGIIGTLDFPTSGYNLTHFKAAELYAISAQDGADSIASCRFNGRHCSNDLLLLARMYGHCYTFNAQVDAAKFASNVGWRRGPPLYTKQTTSDQGLKLMLWVNADDYFYGSRSDTVGFTVAVHSPHKLTTVQSSLVIHAAPGFLTSIGLSYKKVYMTGSPRNPACSNNPVLKPGKDGRLIPYDEAACLFDARRVYIENICGCYWLLAENKRDDLYVTRECNIMEYLTCLVPHLKQFDFDNVTAKFACPEDCVVDTYEYQMSLNVAPSVIWAKFFNKSIDELRSNVAILEVYYASKANHTVWTEPSYTGEDFICDIGGLMGAFAGASLLTILEVLVFARPKRHLVGDSGTTRTIAVKSAKAVHTTHGADSKAPTE